MDKKVRMQVRVLLLIVKLILDLNETKDQLKDMTD